MAIVKIKDANGNWQNVIAVKGDQGPVGPAADTSGLITKSGDRGILAGFNKPASTSDAVTIDASSNDDTIVTRAVAVTVNNGSSRQTWTKTITLQNSSATVTLGTSWKWLGGEVPSVSANSILVVKWCGTFGIANLVTGA